MGHIIDEILNIYILNSSALEKDKVEEIELHLSKCTDCKRFYEEMQTFYSDLSDSEFRCMNTFELSSLYPDTNDNQVGLAAQNAEVRESEFQYFNTYASAEKLILIRAFINDLEGEYNLYLICENKEKIKNTLVTIEGIERNFVSDKEGLLRVKDFRLDKQMKINVHSPIAKFEVYKEKITEEDLEHYCTLQSGMNLKLKSYDSNILSELEITSDFKFKKLKAIILESPVSFEVIDIINRRFSFAKPSLDKFEVIIVEV